MVKIGRARIAPFIGMMVMAGGASAQTPEGAPAVIRAEAREVVVDVGVSGGKDLVAGSLTARDFGVWEDGKAQKINSVSSAAADPEASVKHFVIYFDFMTMAVSDQAASEKYAESFIDAMAGDDRFMAVGALLPSGARVLQDFTTAKTALRNAIAVPMNAGARPVEITGVNSAANVGKLADSLTAVAASLESARGRKAVLLFSGGYPRGETDSRVKALIVACNRANVAVYAIAAAPSVSMTIGPPSPNLATIGPLSQYPGFPMEAMQEALDKMPGAAFGSILADGTGGRSLAFSSRLPNDLAAVAREQDDFYRVAYTPPPSKEGSCHSLRIALNVRGLTARARNEYCNEKPVDLVAGKIEGEALRAHAANSTAAPLDVSAEASWFYTGRNRASVHLAVTLVPDDMKFERDKTGLHGQIDLACTLTNSDGSTAAQFADSPTIDRENQESANAFKRAPYNYQHQFTVAAGKYDLRLVIGVGGNSIGKVSMPLEVDPWNTSVFAIGGIALSTEKRPLEASAAPALEGHGPLVAAGQQFVPVSMNRFRKSDHVYFYTEVYEPALADPNPVDVKMQYRILDRRTGELKQDTGMASVANYTRRGDPVIHFATTLPVVNFSPGAYRLEVLAAHSSGPEVVARTIDFEVN